MRSKPNVVCPGKPRPIGEGLLDRTLRLAITYCCSAGKHFLQ